MFSPPETGETGTRNAKKGVVDMQTGLNAALDRLADEFSAWDWTYRDHPDTTIKDKIFLWPGNPDDDIMICALRAKHIEERFHRQDFFFINYAYQGDYQALSARYDNLITVHEGDCYLGQPFSGYALRGDSEKEILILGALIKKETFFREYLSPLATESSMFHFLLDPQIDSFSDEHIHLSLEKHSPVRSLFELAVIEYANRREDTQAILKPLILTLFLYVARMFNAERPQKECVSLADQIIQYMEHHTDAVSLRKIAAHFSYHPNYISAILRRKTGHTFSEILLGKRME